MLLTCHPLTCISCQFVNPNFLTPTCTICLRSRGDSASSAERHQELLGSPGHFHLAVDLLKEMERVLGMLQPVAGGWWLVVAGGGWQLVTTNMMTVADSAAT